MLIATALAPPNHRIFLGAQNFSDRRHVGAGLRPAHGNVKIFHNRPSRLIQARFQVVKYIFQLIEQLVRLGQGPVGNMFFNVSMNL
jgi:hypothetical protein